MRKCLIDTYAMSLFMSDKTPEKWDRIWREIRMGKRSLILIEPVISEIYYKNIPKFGMKKTKDRILGIKSYSRAEIISLDDNDAFNAGEIKIRFSNYNLSLVDCFLLSVGRKHKALILTTDHLIRDVAKKIGVEVNFLPLRRYQ